ncbi:MAG TPA: S8 family serine peptidase, partial [Acidimicrobiia bacterium]|nr:S8 family serine peptidase [Acidimicrobiia bacterium]
VLATHQDLAGSVLAGTDLASDKATYDPAGTGGVDPGGHGTHVAGIIAAHPNNGVGISGAAPGVKILPVRVLDHTGSGFTSDVADGIDWAVDHGARVINLSLGGGPSPGIQTAMQYALAHNVVVVAAGGNDYLNGNTPTYPAAYPEAIAVAAVDHNLQRASFSNTGSYIDIAAPGDSIWSLWGQGPTQYALASGTSMATPYVAAAAALVVAINPSLTAAEITTVLEATATDLWPSGVDHWYGHGLVNPRKAVARAMPYPVNRGGRGNGYWITTINGRVKAFGHAQWYGDMRYYSASAPTIASAPMSDGSGYWLVGIDGTVAHFGHARFFGDLHGRRVVPIVAFAATPSNQGYMLVARNGHVFAFGDAQFYGSLGFVPRSPIRSVQFTSTGLGYFITTADGSVYAFGDARGHDLSVQRSFGTGIMAMDAAPDDGGYWLSHADGRVFAINETYMGTLRSWVRKLLGVPYTPLVGLSALSTKNGYYILGLNGSVYAFGAAKNFGYLSGVWAVNLMMMP